MKDYDAIVIGGGISGLSCAAHLCRGGAKVLLLEKGEVVGGRVKTSEYEGFLLDHGFQVYLTSYDEPLKIFSLEELELSLFPPGAMIWREGGFHSFEDALRNPSKLPSLLSFPFASWKDLAQLGALRAELALRSPSPLQKASYSAREWLERKGISRSFRESFFTPFFQGVFLEEELQSSGILMEYLFARFSEGSAALPAQGMRKLPSCLAHHCGEIRVNTPVKEWDAHSVTTENGETFTADSVIVAMITEKEHFRYGCTQVFYYEAFELPFTTKLLLLNGSTQGVINNVAFLSEVCPSYAPKGKFLIGVNTLSSSIAEEHIRRELFEWFGVSASSWRFLRSYQIPNALPLLLPHEARAGFKVQNGWYEIGDHLAYPSQNGACLSGRLCAEHILS